MVPLSVTRSSGFPNSRGKGLFCANQPGPTIFSLEQEVKRAQPHSLRSFLYASNVSFVVFFLFCLLSMSPMRLRRKGDDHEDLVSLEFDTWKNSFFMSCEDYHVCSNFLSECPEIQMFFQTFLRDLRQMLFLLASGKIRKVFQYVNSDATQRLCNCMHKIWVSNPLIIP